MKRLYLIWLLVVVSKKLLLVSETKTKLRYKQGYGMSLLAMVGFMAVCHVQLLPECKKKCGVLWLLHPHSNLMTLLTYHSVTVLGLLPRHLSFSQNVEVQGRNVNVDAYLHCISEHVPLYMYVTGCKTTIVLESYWVMLDCAIKLVQIICTYEQAVKWWNSVRSYLSES